MSRSVNKVILLGHLGKDAETKFTPSGVARTTFSLATSRRWKDRQTDEWKEETDWHNVVLWRSENLANYLNKGTQVYVEGRLATRSYDDRDGNKRYVTEVVADEVILAGGGGGERQDRSNEYNQERRPPSQQRKTAQQPQPQPQQQGYENPFPDDDDVPF